MACACNGRGPLVPRGLFLEVSTTEEIFGPVTSARKVSKVLDTYAGSRPATSLTKHRLIWTMRCFESNPPRRAVIVAS